MAASKMIRVDIKEVMTKGRGLGESYSSASFILALNTLAYLNIMLDKQMELNRICSGLPSGILILKFPYGINRTVGAVKIVYGKVQIKRQVKTTGGKWKVIYQWVNAIVGMPHFREKIKAAREAETWENFKYLSSDDKLFYTEVIEGSQAKDRKLTKKKLRNFLEKILGIDIDNDLVEFLLDDVKEE